METTTHKEFIIGTSRVGGGGAYAAVFHCPTGAALTGEVFCVPEAPTRSEALARARETIETWTFCECGKH